MNNTILYIYIIILSACLSSVSFAQSITGLENINFGQSFIPDYIFEGGNLTDWHIIGDAVWNAENSNIIGNSTNGEGLLVFNHSYQDVGFRALFKCTGDCETGVLFRMEKAKSGYTGVFMSLHQDDLLPYRVMINEKGEITSRELMHSAGGIGYRVAPSYDYDAEGAANRDSQSS